MARYYKEIAELLEKERAFTDAIEYYTKVKISIFYILLTLLTLL